MALAAAAAASRVAAAHTTAAEPEMTPKVPEVVLDAPLKGETDPKQPNLFVKIQIYQVPNPA